jgi:hypothetical protein
MNITRSKEEIERKIAHCKSMLEIMEKDYEKARARIESWIEELDIELKEATQIHTSSRIS